MTADLRLCTRPWGAGLSEDVPEPPDPLAFNFNGGPTPAWPSCWDIACWVAQHSTSETASSPPARRFAPVAC